MGKPPPSAPRWKVWRRSRFIGTQPSKARRTAAFGGCARQLEQADPSAAERLQGLGFLNRSNANRAAELLSELQVEQPLYLVIDNFQFVLGNWQPPDLQCPGGTPGREPARNFYLPELRTAADAAG